MCKILNTTEIYVTLHCVPGYDGGATLHFPVEAQQSGGGTFEPDVRLEWDSSLAAIRVLGLNPATDYDLKVFSGNQYGRSQGSVLVAVRTDGGKCNIAHTYYTHQMSTLSVCTE